MILPIAGGGSSAKRNVAGMRMIGFQERFAHFGDEIFRTEGFWQNGQAGGGDAAVADGLLFVTGRE